MLRIWNFPIPMESHGGDLSSFRGDRMCKPALRLLYLQKDELGSEGRWSAGGVVLRVTDAGVDLVLQLQLERQGWVGHPEK